MQQTKVQDTGLTLDPLSVGAVCFGLGFRNLDYKDAFILMGSVIIVSVVPTAFIYIKGHSALFCGEDTEITPPEDAAKGTLTVPEQQAVEDDKMVVEDIEEEIDC